MVTWVQAAALVVAGCFAFGAGVSADTPSAVRGLVVEPGPGPAVRSTYPAAGASAPGGVMVLKIVFDRPMTEGAWAYGRSSGGDFPHCLATPRLLADRRTFVLLCTVESSRTYALTINPAPRFASANGRSAQPFTLTFATTADATGNLHDALAQAGLADTDDPIMTWKDPGAGVSQSPAPQ
jgi:hypothetical protein